MLPHSVTIPDGFAEPRREVERAALRGEPEVCGVECSRQSFGRKIIRAFPQPGDIRLPIERDRVNWAGRRAPQRSRPPGFLRLRAGTGEFHPADTTTPAETGGALTPVIPQESDWL